MRLQPAVVEWGETVGDTDCQPHLHPTRHTGSHAPNTSPCCIQPASWLHCGDAWAAEELPGPAQLEALACGAVFAPCHVWARDEGAARMVGWKRKLKPLQSEACTSLAKGTGPQLDQVQAPRTAPRSQNTGLAARLALASHSTSLGKPSGLLKGHVQALLGPQI